jgi:hypothetical protein
VTGNAKFQFNSIYQGYEMNKKINFCLKVGLGLAGCVAAIGAAQATSLTSLGGSQGNTTWQDIASASYTFNDTNHDGKLNTGEILTFTIEMNKDHWGMHDFDALKVWIGGTEYKSQWNFSTADSRADLNGAYHGAGLPYELPNQSFSFDYTASTVGTLDLYASVMCNADLSGLVVDGTSGSHGTATSADWAAWSSNIHQSRPKLQGEDERYQVNVSPVPEPETYAMLMAGLGLIAPLARRRKAKQ